jgi:amino acid adenylation domain-containing protein
MIEDSRVAVVLDREALAGIEGDDSDPRVPVSAEHPAYVIYTSGSTGKPKGVQISHRAVVNFMAAMQQLFHLSDGDVLFSVTSLSFDIAGLELHLPLTVGASVWLASREVTIEPEALREELSKSGASIMQATPSTWRMLLDANWEGDRSLKILCGGEALPRELAAQVVDRCGELWNMYGPTETTIWSLSRRIHEHDRITIGFPIGNTQVYVFDEHMLRVPVGVSGELYIGGDGLARGYLRRPGLTAERFIPDPHATELGRRLYRTGDLVRYLQDGSIEFLGRMDQQIKLRGHRIEMGEIEAALDTHPRIRQSVVLAREDVPGDKRLIAYLLGKAGTSGPEIVEVNGGIAASEVDEVLRYELRGHLRERLPEYMVPSAFVFVSRLPLTPNGKVDRKALPAPAAVGVKRHGSAASAPRSHLEDALATLWAEVLAVDSVAPADNFFELGGHSLLAMQVVSRVRERLGAEVGVGRLFAAPTLAGFAGEVERALREDEGLTAPPLVRVARAEQALPLSFAQQRLWFLEQLESGTALYNIPAAVRLKGRLETEALARALAEIVRRHEVLRTSFVSQGGEPVQVIAPSVPSGAAPWVVEEAPGGDAETWVCEVAQAEARRGVDLARGALLRVR